MTLNTFMWSSLNLPTQCICAYRPQDNYVIVPSYHEAIETIPSHTRHGVVATSLPIDLLCEKQEKNCERQRAWRARKKAKSNLFAIGTSGGHDSICGNPSYLDETRYVFHILLLFYYECFFNYTNIFILINCK